MTYALNTVTATICDACLDGVGGECHVPGCLFWMSQAPDIPVRDRCEMVPAPDDAPPTP